jgi:hypothetical protein
MLRLQSKTTIALILALAALVGTTFGELYSRGRIPQIGWLNSFVLDVAGYLAPYVDRRPNFSSALEEKIAEQFPELRSYLRNELEIHTLTRAEPLPRLGDPAFEYTLVERWCNRVPLPDALYGMSQFRVSKLYEDFIGSLQISSGIGERETQEFLSTLQPLLQEEARLFEKDISKPSIISKISRIQKIKKTLMSDFLASVEDRLSSMLEASAIMDFHRATVGLFDTQNRHSLSKACKTEPDIENWLKESEGMAEGIILAEGPARLIISEPRPDEPGESVNISVGELESNIKIEKGSSDTSVEIANHTPVSLQVQRAQVIKLDRGLWFDQELLRTRWNGPWNESGAPLIVRDHRTARIPVALVVVYNPHFTLSLRGDLESAIGDIQKRGGVFSAGPMRMAVGKKESDARIEILGDTDAHVFYGQNRAYVIAVITAKMPDVEI